MAEPVDDAGLKLVGRKTVRVRLPARPLSKLNQGMRFNFRRLWFVWAVICVLGGLIWWAWEYSQIEQQIFLTKTYSSQFESTVAEYTQRQKFLPFFIGPIVVVLVAAPVVLLKVWRWVRITP